MFGNNKLKERIEHLEKTIEDHKEFVEIADTIITTLVKDVIDLKKDLEEVGNALKTNVRVYDEAINLVMKDKQYTNKNMQGMLDSMNIIHENMVVLLRALNEKGIITEDDLPEKD
jgi:predicted  nucleic acid-binding Zn-ribbon protein